MLGGAASTTRIIPEFVKYEHKERALDNYGKHEPEEGPHADVRQQYAPRGEVHSGEPSEVPPKGAVPPVTAISANRRPKENARRTGETPPALRRHPGEWSNLCVENDGGDKSEADQDLDREVEDSLSREMHSRQRRLTNRA